MAVAGLFALLIAACAGGGSPNAAETAGTFAYGTGNFLDLNIRGTFGAKRCPCQ